MANWWLTQRGKEPVGPVDTERVVRGIRAGRVPSDSLVCEVGGKQWHPIADVAPFAAAFAPLGSLVRFQDSDERTVVDDAASLDPPTEVDANFDLSQFDDLQEQTIVEDAPVPVSNPPGPPPEDAEDLSGFASLEDERTIADDPKPGS